MIIVEGADNTGKTSLVNHLIERFKLEKVPRYHTLPPQDYKEWAEYSIGIMSRRDVSNLIADRFFISEFVYGPIMRHKIGIHFEDQLELIDAFRDLRPLIILCDPGDEAISKNFNDRQQYPELDDNLKVARGFRNVLRLPPFTYSRQIVYDYTVDPDYKNIDMLLKQHLLWR